MLVRVEVVAASGLLSGAALISWLAFPKSLDLGLELKGEIVEEDVSTARAGSVSASAMVEEEIFEVDTCWTISAPGLVLIVIKLFANELAASISFCDVVTVVVNNEVNSSGSFLVPKLVKAEVTIKVVEAGVVAVVTVA